MNQSVLILPDPIDDVSTLENRPTIFLSASVPFLRNPLEFEPMDRQAVEDINRVYVAGARPERIRAAVVALARVVLARRTRDHGAMRLVFGAHPSISPMILQAAQDMNASADSILVFQSNAYRALIPGSTLHFSDWSCGHLILTSEQRELPFLRTPMPPGKELKRLSPYPESLRFERRLMLSVPGLLGGVFIGGMNGVEDESAMFEQLQQGKPRFALPSTGSAAERLDRNFPGAFNSTLPDPQALRDTPSYTVAASMILDQLNP